MTIEDCGGNTGSTCVEDLCSVALGWFLFGYRYRLSYVQNVARDDLR